MALRLPRFQAGRPITEEVTAEKLNQIVDAIRQCELQGGVGYDVTRGPGGATLAIRRDNMIPSSQLGAAYVIGPPSTGVAQDGTLIAAGDPTPAWSVKRPGSDVFEPIYVFGEIKYFYEPLPLSCSSASKVYRKGNSDIYLSAADLVRFVGVLAPHQGNVYTYTDLGVCNPYSEITDPCGQTWDNRYQQNEQFSAAGAFGELSDGCYNYNGETGTYVFRCTFHIGQINPSQIKVRFRLRTNNVQNIQTSVSSIQLNSQAASFSPSGSFSTDTGFNETREISEGFVTGINTFDIVVNHPTERYYPGIKCQFLPTTALIVARDNGGDVSGFSDLTDGQVDLIGQGTPVKALDGSEPYIWSYTGVGNKRSSGSYTQLRPA